MSLTFAVPRGALFEATLDLLDRLGIDTAEVRDHYRKLPFEHAGGASLLTMRPTDVPTRVVAGLGSLFRTGYRHPLPDVAAAFTHGMSLVLVLIAAVSFAAAVIAAIRLPDTAPTMAAPCTASGRCCRISPRSHATSCASATTPRPPCSQAQPHSNNTSSIGSASQSHHNVGRRHRHTRWN